MRYHHSMPVIRCSKCGQAYDVPGVIAVRLPNSIATCSCGEWLSGSKAAVLARLLDPSQIREIDMQPYRVEAEADAEQGASATAVALEEPPVKARSIRVLARAAHESIDKVFTISEHPLWIGRRSSHIELAEAELSLRHCSISLRGGDLVAWDADSHLGTFLDGERITEAVIPDGVHLLRVGAALITIEPTDQPGMPVEPVSLSTESVGSGLDEFAAAPFEQAEIPEEPKRHVLICVEGGLKGQEFEIPPTGLVIGREGHVRVPDEYLSRRHFEVLFDEEGNVRVRDLGSRNGTFLNTLPAQNTRVHAGDEICAGVNRFRIEERA